MKAIYKYQLGVTDVQTVELPAGAKVLSVGTQRESIFAWALVNTDRDTEPRTFVIKGTGHPIESGELDDTRFIGTVMLSGGALVFHIFEAAR